ncbi:sigma-70 family RNA polymerase sigma factor [Geobacillus subterraneus]|uniref:RNA polymerase sigma factor n=1 Tax=Geobacillus subterraneus TaxID=129338 RepID=A0A679FV97_9BACL|nr:sigma-70 family RNA polymerase sigma factor [Geobacillus subterraneus]BBW98909.1 RNA polymerase sigma factor [Geobacillus subterraneus]
MTSESVVCSTFSEEEREKIAAENYPLIHYVARGFLSSGVPYEELVGAATIGFVKALNSYNQEREAKFSTFAINCMKNEVLLLLRKELKHQYHCVSMEKVLSRGSRSGRDFLVEHTIAASDKDELASRAIQEEEKDLLFRVLEHLSPRDRYILIYRYGLDRGIVKTQKEVAEAVGMSQANVSKVEKAILKRVRMLIQREMKLGDSRDGDGSC